MAMEGALALAELRQRQEIRFLDATAARTDRPCLGAEIGLRVDARRTSLLSHAIFNSPTLGDALGNMVRSGLHYVPPIGSGAVFATAIVAVRESPSNYTVDELGPGCASATSVASTTSSNDTAADPENSPSFGSRPDPS